MFRWRWLILIPFAVFYVMCLPHTVQALDTGDVVASGVRLWVAHPPGYPLYAWLLHGFLKIVPWDTPFWRAALLTSFYVIGGLAFLLALAESWLGVVAVAVLASVPVVARYAVMPDVFGLHLLLTSALLYCVLARYLRQRELCTCIAFGLAAANHQTIVFLAPAVVLVLLHGRSWKRSVTALAVGGSISVALYLSLLFFDVESANSWGVMRTPLDVLGHFLRRDFGTFTLFAAGKPVPFWRTFAAMSAEIWAVLTVFVVAIAAHFNLRRRAVLTTYDDRAWLLVLVGLLLYVGFFLAKINFPDVPRWAATRERFFIYPAVLMTALAVRSSIPVLARPLVASLGGAMVLVCIASFAGALPLRSLPTDTLIEDWVRNMLDVAAAGDKPHFVILDGDTEFFGARYVEAVDGERDIVPIGIGMAFDFKVFNKIKRLRPSFVLDQTAVKTSDDHGIIKLMVEPNIDNYDFTTSLRFVTPRLKTIYYPCGRRFVRGEGIAFAPQPGPLRLNPPDYDLETADPDTTSLWNAYADYYIARARVATRDGDQATALRAYKEAWMLVPWCAPCRENACALERDAGIADAACDD